MRLLSCSLSVLLLGLAGFIHLGVRSRVLAQGNGPSLLVVDGGTLIDRNGGAPVRDVQIVVDGNLITNIGRKGRRKW